MKVNEVAVSKWRTLRCDQLGIPNAPNTHRCKKKGWGTIACVCGLRSGRYTYERLSAVHSQNARFVHVLLLHTDEAAQFSRVANANHSNNVSTPCQNLSSPPPWDTEMGFAEVPYIVLGRMPCTARLTYILAEQQVSPAQKQ